ncbi:conserved hypothetical protein [Culex quinquefasciatus]|uniref:Uncharacterized protein n=1 Tax=Culex quinquefasciatus TaxID=7176 RepID=B0W6B4_CULQU|nr:conserved hypothetical protein [Culex quinquefasciatus]|eukprot:XP_001844248.1 conserved hypothetical protein [Culex quinquefasciatus]
MLEKKSQPDKLEQNEVWKGLVCCKLYSKSNLRTKSDGVQFLRLKEDFPVGGEIVSLYAYPRNSILIARTENSSDGEYFKLKEVNSTRLLGLKFPESPQQVAVINRQLKF